MSSLLFVACDTPNGRTRATKTALIRAHTLNRNRTFRHESRSGSISQVLARPKVQATNGGVKIAEHSGALPSTAEESDASRCDVVEKESQAILLGESSSLPYHVAPVHTLHPQAKSEDVEKIGQWYFYNPLQGTYCEYFRQAEFHWTNGLWEMARINQPMLAAISAFAIHKQITLAKDPSQSTYLKHKGRTIWQISRDLCAPRTSPDPPTMVAIALLAYMEMRDARFDAAMIHLRAIRRLFSISRMPTYVWLYCVWIDLRYALLTAQRPILPYYIPISLRWSCSTQSVEGAREASENTADCPHSELLAHEIAFELFHRLHALCSLSTELEDTDTPPFGRIYDVEYALRAVQARIPKHGFREDVSLAVELVILTIQLHVWMACRFWTPQRRESHIAVHSRASTILDDFHDIVPRWTKLSGARCLLWILFTVLASDMLHGSIRTGGVIDSLQAVLILLKVRCQEDFTKELSRWPWIKNWHPVHVNKVWAKLQDRLGGVEVASLDSQSVGPLLTPAPSPQRLFLGGLEFYNSSC